jgi:predicted glutamine amidotransferase
LSGFGQAIVHLRKATIGKNSIHNTHPFFHSGISFCHNGSIHSFSDAQYINDKFILEGNTDSEIFFMRIFDRVFDKKNGASVENLKIALLEEIREIQKVPTWTSLSCLIKTKNYIILNYLWNESHPQASKLEFDKYYTFYTGKKDGVTMLCSEVLDIDGFTWEKLPNDSLLVIPL